MKSYLWEQDTYRYILGVEGDRTLIFIGLNPSTASLFDLSYIKVYKTSGEYICIANRVVGSHPLANQMGEIKDIEDLKQKTKIKKQLEKRTQENYIKALKRQKAYFPMLTNDLEEKQELDELKQFCIFHTSIYHSKVIKLEVSLGEMCYFEHKLYLK